MKGFLIKFKIPTILGLTIIISGIAVGVFLTLREQNFISKATPQILPQNITLANISDTEVSLSWQTSGEVASFISFGINNPNEQVSLDDRDLKTPMPHLMHYVTIKNLLPQTTYQYKIFSSKFSTATNKFTTAASLNQTGLRPIIGSVLDGNKVLAEGVVYLSIADATTQAALIKTSGSFLIPISQIRKADLSEGFKLTEDTLLKLTVISEKGQVNVLFKLKDSDEGLPPIHLGENLDLTTSINPSSDALKKYDLNGDGKINAADNSIVLQNFGKNPKDKSADLNGDGVVDQKDLDLMGKQINQ